MTAEVKTLVIKIGSGVLAAADGLSLDLDRCARLVRQIAHQVHSGRHCVVVSSGAVAAGLMELGMTQRPTDLAAVQACSAIGQSLLMHAYETFFREHDLRVGQLL